MKNTSYIKRSVYLLLFLLIRCASSLYGTEGAGMAFKASLSGKVYKHFSFLLEEEIHPEDEFKGLEWFLSTVEVNYRLNKYLLAGGGYMSIVHHKTSDATQNRYYLYATGTYRIGHCAFSLRERYQSTYKAHSGHPNNALRSKLNISYITAKSDFAPFAYAEFFNNTQDRGRTSKIRLSAGSDYQLSPRNRLQLYYRYHIFNSSDNLNNRHTIGLCYTHRF